MNTQLDQEKVTRPSYPKWKRVGEVIKPQKENNKKLNVLISNIEEKNIKINRISWNDTDLDQVLYHPFEDELEKFDSFKYGTDEAYIFEASTSFNTGIVINIDENTHVEKPIIIDYKFDKDISTIIDYNFIKVEKGSTCHIVIRYLGDVELGYHSGMTKLYVEEDAKLKITKVQLLGDKINHVDNNVSIIESKGHVEYSCVDLGSGLLATNYYARLEGDESISETITAYLGDGKRKLDIGYDAVHVGKRTNSLIDCHGALLDESRKVFRGNLKFEKGAKKSVGSESEYVLLLDKRVHSDAIPALLCDEDDVNGEHAASAGQVNEDQLFYLMSRGFSLLEAKKLIIHGSFSKVIDLIPTKELQEEVEEELERRLLYGGNVR